MTLYLAEFRHPSPAGGLRVRPRGAAVFFSFPSVSIVSIDAMRLLVVDDDPALREALELMLDLHGFEVVTASTGDTGFQLAVSQPFDCLVLDLMLPGRDGLSLLAQLRREGKSVPVLILTAKLGQ